MSDTSQNTNSVPKVKIPFSPTRGELLKLYPDARPNYIKGLFKTVKKECPSKVETRNLTCKQFKAFIIEIGSQPPAFKQSDFHFLDGLDLS